ncbi:MAG: hypothetical protein EOP47_12485 [Sphingobacteriaceae bacterium]|nr:MAG: hypothetical protein EOP47_12485 [Sphingobacteriaceae bacterium]
MKVLFNKLSAFIFFAVFSTAVLAQPVPDTMRVNVGITAGLPIALNDMYTHNLGGFLQVDYPLTRTLYVTGSAGYNTLFASPNFSTTPGGILGVKAANMQTVPLKIGIKLFTIRHFYLKGEVGQTLLLNKAAVYAPKSNAFTFSPGAGMLFFLKNHTYIDGGIRYEAVSSFYNDKANYGFWSAHIAYAFNL